MTTDRGDTAAFITAYNEEDVIGTVIETIPDRVVPYLIDDGSSDKTASIARNKGAQVISHPINDGQGTAVITAFKYFVETDYRFVVELDGDGQHDPSEIPKFLEVLETTDVDVVAGSRLLGSNYDDAPIFRRLGLRPLNFILSLITGYDLSDFMCGFRAFRNTSLQRVAPLFEDLSETQYLASEMWIKFSRANLTATDVPINLRARKSGRSYKGHALARYGFGVLRTILRTLLETYREDPDR